MGCKNLSNYLWQNCTFITFKKFKLCRLIEFLHGRFSEQATHCAKVAKNLNFPLFQTGLFVTLLVIPSMFYKQDL